MTKQRLSTKKGLLGVAGNFNWGVGGAGMFGWGCWSGRLSGKGFCEGMVFYINAVAFN